MVFGIGMVTMPEPSSDPFGLGAPRQRLDEAETGERMLAAGERLVSDAGLRISFDLLRIEDVIAEANVSRSAVYKRWPRKELYYADLLLRLAGAPHPVQGAFDPETLLTAVQVVQQNLSWLRTADGRRRLLIEVCRLGALRNFEALRTRPDWHLYMTLHAALSSLPANDYRTTLRNALAASENGFIEAMVEFYAVMVGVIGYRPKDDSGEVGFAELAALGGAVVQGLVLTYGATPELAERRFLIDPFEVGEMQEWSFAAIGFTSIATALLEQDDMSPWSDEKLEEI